MEKTILISSELYKRLEAHATGFDTPANVIEKILNFYENNFDTSIKTSEVKIPAPTPARSFQLEVIFHPNNENEFKKLLLSNKVAWVKLFNVNGRTETKKWKAQSFTQQSDVMGNLRSGYLRGWREKGICKAVLAIDPDDLPS
ncbi:MAG: hypothetical protein CXR31_05895 [Geobacter sp.]|nr:MAG: hypothetical protein CXR31_05895 [Geobacter sp.]